MERCQEDGATAAFLLRLGKRGYRRVFVLLWCSCAYALNPALDISQYAHKSWTIRDGFFNGRISSIAQTPDGFLWLGTEFGLLRFDGVRFVGWEPPAGEHLPSGDIRALLTARDGCLWIGTEKGLASWKGGKLTRHMELDGREVVSLLEDRKGTLWAAGWAASVGRLCAFQGGIARCFGDDGIFGHYLFSLYEDKAGGLWAGAETGLWRWKPDPPKFFPTPHQPNFLIEGDNGAPLIATRVGIRRLVDGKEEAYPLAGAGRQFRATKLFRERSGSLWVGTDTGLLHIHRGRTDAFAQSDGLSGDYVIGFFEDREGNIWVSTVGGLDRFRDFPVPTISVKQGLSNDLATSILAARDGSVWIGTFRGLNRSKDAQITIYRKGGNGLLDDAVESLFQDDRGRIWVSTATGLVYFQDGHFMPVRAVPAGELYSIAQDAPGNIWIAHREGLIHLAGERVVERIPSARLGHADSAIILLPDPVGVGLWLGFAESGIAYLKEGQVRASYAGAEGLGKGRVGDLQFDRQGALWAATEGGLSRIKNGRVATLTARNGLPCDTVHWVMEDDDGSFWLYMACGLVRIARPELDAWAADPKRTVRAGVYGSSDGVGGRSQATDYSPRVAKTADGKLWFATLDGVSVLDPHNLHLNKLPPPVHIEQITADRKTYPVTPNMHLPPLIRDVWIDYTALSLVAPEKVRFRYKLEGQDTDWKEVVNDRQAQYSNLPPRHYRFRVVASNNSGVWNETGDTLDFSIDPAWFQTRTFYASCVAAGLLALWGVYRLRIWQIKREFNMRMDERVEERTRIARELHDTLLQSFQGTSMLFQVALNLLPADSAKAAQILERALEQAGRAITEGRDAIRGMRSSTEVTNDLAEAMRGLGAEMASDGSPEFRVLVEGPPKELHPILRDEIYKLAREALRNAFRHAQARRIEVGITYGDRLLRVCMRDDGRGIDPAIAETGLSGHYGLPGMRERAQRIGAQFNIWTEPGAGTEIGLSIPAAIAYRTGPEGKVRRLFRRNAG